METRRVVITGIGAITPIGHGKEGLWEGAKKGKSGVKTISRFDTSEMQTKVAAGIDNFDPLNYFEAKVAKRMDRFAHFALAATQLAIQDAKLPYDVKKPNSRIGVTIGTALGGMAGGERQHEAFLKKGLRAVDPSLALIVFGGAGSSNIAIQYGFTGPSNANSNSCSSGTIAIGEAFRYIKNGYADGMITGGAEAPLFGLTFGAFTILRAMSSNTDPTTACRPFDKNRDGFVMGEGAAILVLEELQHAQRRDAPIYCEILGYSCNNDGHHMFVPRPSGECAARVMADSISEARITVSDISYVNAHASSTVLNDKTETIAIKNVFGDRAYQVPISGTKSMHGHALGASGAIEAAICANIFEKDFLPPTINYNQTDPECDLDCVPNVGRNKKVDYILSNSFGFGGINSALVFGRYQP